MDNHPLNALAKPTLIVGIGASAGGIEATRAFLEAMPEDSGMAFVLVQHLDPTHESMMAEVLSRFTGMKILQADENMTVQRDHFYVIPPDKVLTIENAQLHTQPFAERRGHRNPIDQFFHSLAESHGPGAVGIVLSGTASDGTEGLKEIKLAGGLTIAQDPREAAQPGMPRSAVSSGAVDYILKANEIPAVLARYAEHPYVARDDAEPKGLSLGESNMEEILSVLRVRVRHDFR